jgi:putative endonuclease
MDGTRYEDAALEYLRARGLELLARNWTSRGGEIDLVMRDRDTLVFVEVRYRSSIDYGGALASIGPAKRRRLLRAASAYLQTSPYGADAPARFDVAALAGPVEAPRVEWIRDAFPAVWR